MPAVADVRREVLQPLVMSWLGKAQEGVRHKKGFNDTAEQCMAFFNGAVGFMWDTKFMTKFMGGGLTPRFKITISKAFELVALFGPTLYWRNPARLMKPRQQLELDPALFSGLDQTGWMLYEQAAMQSQQQSAIDKAVCGLLELYLNYTPTEQPGGGLAGHASSAITEALIKGRGCLWPRPYFMPGSDRVLTGCFYDSVDNLIIDPDATDLSSAKWIMQVCTEPVWQIERNRGLPPGTLNGKGNYMSADAQGRGSADPWDQTDRRIGKSNDLLTYYKVWSKMGVGGRLAGPARMEDQLSRAFDQVIGDYAYIEVAPGVPWPLNCPTELVRSATDAEIKARFQWPAPYWLDDRWPVTVLDFYRAPNDPWAIAPLAPGLGELTFLNVMISQMANHIWMSSRTFVGLPKGVEKELEAAILSGGDFVPLKYGNLGGGQKMKDILDFIQHPQMNPDAWKIVDAILAMFDRRVGLTELLYGLNPGGVQSRTAEDIATKREMVSIRPDYMAGRVEDWMTEAADMEKLCARWFVEAQDTRGLFGPVEQYLWKQHVTDVDPEHLIRDLRATIAANSTRKPDKIRDTENMQQILPALIPMMQEHMMLTGDVSGINGLLQKWGKTIDQDMSEMLLPPLQQSGNPEAEAAAQAQQMELEAHQQKLAMQQQQHGQQMLITGQKAQADQAVAQMRLQTMQQQLKLRAQAAKAKPKPKARAA